jgi:hypothetical protein
VVGDGEEDALLRLRWVVQKRVPAPPTSSVTLPKTPAAAGQGGKCVRQSTGGTVNLGEAEGGGGGQRTGGGEAWLEGP